MEPSILKNRVRNDNLVYRLDKLKFRPDFSAFRERRSYLLDVVEALCFDIGMKRPEVLKVTCNKATRIVWESKSDIKIYPILTLLENAFPFVIYEKRNSSLEHKVRSFLHNLHQHWLFRQEFLKEKNPAPAPNVYYTPSLSDFKTDGPILIKANKKHEKISVSETSEFDPEVDLDISVLRRWRDAATQKDYDEFRFWPKTEALKEERTIQLGKEERAEDSDMKKFFASREWAALRYWAISVLSKKCQCCGGYPSKTNNVQLQVDHIYPVRLYWHLRNKPWNLQVLCNTCNWGKGIDFFDCWTLLEDLNDIRSENMSEESRKIELDKFKDA